EFSLDSMENHSKSDARISVRVQPRFPARQQVGAIKPTRELDAPESRPWLSEGKVRCRLTKVFGWAILPVTDSSGSLNVSSAPYFLKQFAICRSRRWRGSSTEKV